MPYQYKDHKVVNELLAMSNRITIVYPRVLGLESLDKVKDAWRCTKVPSPFWLICIPHLHATPQIVYINMKGHHGLLYTCICLRSL